MSTYPCDQFAADAFAVIDEIESETGVTVNFDMAQVEGMVEDIERAMRQEVITDPEELTESVMGRYNFAHDKEYAAYKRLLDKIFKRRMGARSSMHSRNGRFAEFAPLE